MTGAITPTQVHPPRRRTFVLVHGAWHGGWCWRRVADILEAAGHDVHAPTLTGLGERAHLLSGDITLDTHIRDVVDCFESNDVRDAVLCGHSYGSWVISGAVEYVPSRVASIVFVDAYVPSDGQSGLETAPRDVRDSILRAHDAGAVARPAPPAAALRVNARDRAWVDARLTSQPLGVSFQKIRLTGAVERVATKAYVRAAGYPSVELDRVLTAVRARTTWRTYTVPGGHDVMVDEPVRLAEILIEVS